MKFKHNEVNQRLRFIKNSKNVDKMFLAIFIDDLHHNTDLIQFGPHCAKFIF